MEKSDRCLVGPTRKALWNPSTPVNPKTLPVSQEAVGVEGGGTHLFADFLRDRIRLLQGLAFRKLRV